MVGFERNEMEERWVRRRRWLVVNGSGEGFGHLLLVFPLKVGGGPMGSWGLLGFCGGGWVLKGMKWKRDGFVRGRG